MVISVGDIRGARQSIVAATAGAVATDRNRRIGKPYLIVIAALSLERSCPISARSRVVGPALPCGSAQGLTPQLWRWACSGPVGTKNGALTPILRRPRVPPMFGRTAVQAGRQASGLPCLTVELPAPAAQA